MPFQFKMRELAIDRAYLRDWGSAACGMLRWNRVFPSPSTTSHHLACVPPAGRGEGEKEVQVGLAIRIIPVIG